MQDCFALSGYGVEKGIWHVIGVPHGTDHVAGVNIGEESKVISLNGHTIGLWGILP